HLIFLTAIFFIDVIYPNKISHPSKVIAYVFIYILVFILCVWSGPNSKWMAHISTFVLGITICCSFLVVKAVVSSSTLTQTQLFQRAQPDQNSGRLPLTQIAHIYLLIITTDDVAPQHFVEKIQRTAEKLLATISYILLAFLPFTAPFGRTAFLIVNVLVSVPALYRLLTRQVFPTGRLEMMPCLWLGIVLVAIGFCSFVFVITKDIIASMLISVTLALQVAVVCDITEELFMRKYKVPLLPPPPVQQLQQA
ncbi:hypothetical protein PFISCL1PPCAC_21900, partial [Pristionchus fissidentatus]